MNMQHDYEFLHAEGSATPIKGWVHGVPVEDKARQQLQNIATLPFVGPWVAVVSVAAALVAVGRLRRDVRRLHGRDLADPPPPRMR